MLSLKNFAGLVSVALFMTGAAQAQILPPPTGNVVLTVSGHISNTNVDGTAQFDQAMLDDLGRVDIETQTPWYDDTVRFTGTPLAAVLEAVGAEGEILKAVALNDYETDIPMTDAWDTDVILASRLNGEIMTVRDKGPIFVIYPYSREARFQTQTYYSRSAWQVTTLIVR